MARAFLPPPSPQEDRLRFARRRPDHILGWQVPEDLDLTVHALVAERLRALDAVARQTGGPLPVERALANPRWWPGRQAEPKALSNLFHGRWRTEEEHGFDPSWYDAFNEALDVLYEAAGLPAVSPEAWVLAATDYAVRRTAEEQS